jgi:hypothetical protein
MGHVVNPYVAAAPILNADITWIINIESFQSLVDFGVLDDDKDILEMVMHLGSHMEVAGHVYVGTIQVKKLQTLYYSVHDHQKCGQVIDHNDWDKDTVHAMIEMMCIERG